ncbi:acetyl-CoA carboxylase biotin carboxylase subunit family protein [Pseudomonas sp. UV AK001]|uniref:ATP-grasp domain-containing protein n=1 Tax=Pseudomonas sp. UV AK001 TaxID=3384791 RepID=UPI0038D4873B
MDYVLMVDCTDVTSAIITAANKRNLGVIFIRSELTRNHTSLTNEFFTGNTVATYDVESSLDVETLENLMKKISHTYPVAAVFTPLDDIVELVAAAARGANLKGTSHEGVANAKNKARARDLLKAEGLTRCAHRTCRTLEQLPSAVDAIGYPCIVKPVSGFAKYLTAHLETPQDLQQFMTEYESTRNDIDSAFRGFISDEYTVEEYINGQMYSAEVARNEHGFYPLMLTRRDRAKHNELLEIESTMAPRGHYADERAVFEYCEKVVDCLKLDVGVFHIEVIVGNGRVDLVEVNPRFMGGALSTLFQKSTSLSAFDILLDTYLGKVVETQAKTRLFSTSRRLAPMQQTISRATVDAGYMQEHFPWVREHSIAIQEGQVILPMTGNDSSLGYIHIVAEHYSTALEQAKATISQITAATGIELAN